MHLVRTTSWLVPVFLLSAEACSSAGSSDVGSAGNSSGGSAPSSAAGMAGLATAGTLSSSSGGSSTAGSGEQPGTSGNAGTGTAPTAGAGGGAAGGRDGSGAGSGGMSMSGGGRGGAAGSAGSGMAGASNGGSGSGGAPANGNPPDPTGACGKMPTLKNGTINITVSGASRKYILRIPDGYDNSHPYRLVFAFAESGSSASSVASRNYFTMATLDGKNTIFAAPDAVGSTGQWSKTDVAFTDAVLEQLEGDLCIDKSRIFATGFSFGGGMAMALACTRADVLRGVAFFSGADLTNSCPSMLTKPIAYYASQASEDAGGMPTTSPITGEYKQAEFAKLNGCTAEPNSTNFPSAGQPHTCTNYKGCSAGHPTEYCVFNGQHGWEPKDPGQNTSWDAPEAWKFITQF